MPASTVTCPSCNTTLKPKNPVAGGTRIKCPKCATVFAVPADDEAAAPAPVPKPKPAAPRPAAPTPQPAAQDDLANLTDSPVEAAPGVEPADGGAAAIPKKKIPTWVWAAAGGGALLLMCVCCGLPGGWMVMYGVPGLGGGSAAVTDANLKQIKKNMTEADVKKIMGGEPSVTLPVGDIKSDTWKGSGDDFITVQFNKDGKAIATGFQFTSGVAKMSGGGPLQ